MATVRNLLRWVINWWQSGAALATATPRWRTYTVLAENRTLTIERTIAGAMILGVYSGPYMGEYRGAAPDARVFIVEPDDRTDTVR